MKKARAARKLKAKRRVTAIATAVALREGQETAKIKHEMLQRIALVIGRSVASRIARRKVGGQRETEATMASGSSCCKISAFLAMRWREIWLRVVWTGSIGDPSGGGRRRRRAL